METPEEKKAIRMSALELDFGGSFLDHSTRPSGSGFLKNWKDDGRIVVWIHPNAPVFSLWSHNFFHSVVEIDKQTKEQTKRIRGYRVNCLENEKLLKKQKWRNDDDTREMPPEVCPVCLMVEWLRSQINAGKLEWSTPVFKWETEEGDDGEEVVLYAGGITGLFQKKVLTKEEKLQVKKTGTKLNEAYLQNGYARQQYAMAVVPDSDPDANWVIAMEGQTLGDKLKKSIRDEVKRCGGSVEQGHPKYNPYPFEWSYDENKEFSEKYDVVALTRQRPSDKVQALLDSDEMPSFDRLIAAPKLGSLRDAMESAALIKMPFDSFFEGAVEKFGEEYEESEEAETAETAEEEEKPAVKSAVKSTTTKQTDKSSSSSSSSSSKQVKKAIKEEEEEEEEEVDEEPVEDVVDETDDPILCDVCEAPIAADAETCMKCGTCYELTDDGNVCISSRKCANPDCMETAVPLREGEHHTCPQCGAIHDNDWAFKLPAKKASRTTPKAHADAVPSRRARARAALSE